MESDVSRQSHDDGLLIVDAGNPAAADFVGRALEETSTLYVPAQLRSMSALAATDVVVFLRYPWCDVDDPALEEVLRQLTRLVPNHVCFVTSCADILQRTAAVHPRIRIAMNRLNRSNAPAGRQLNGLEGRLSAALPAEIQISVLRTGCILSEASPIVRWCRRLTWLRPLLPRSLRSTFVTIPELTDALTDLLSSTDETPIRSVVLLGRSRGWKDVLHDAAIECSHGSRSMLLTAAARIFRALGAGVLLRTAVTLLIRRHPQLRMLDFDTIIPDCESDLLSLCGRQNSAHVAVCGYNNGVNHFGWEQTKRTVVSTIRTARTIQVADDFVDVDAGIVLWECSNELQSVGKELFVVPNFSFVSMGTCFFVPVHGSGTQVSTLGDTIIRIRCYDPKCDAIVEADRGDSFFEQAMYNRHSGLVLLQLRLRIRDRVGYHVERSEIRGPSAEEVWSLFGNADAANVEVRKNRATADAIQIARYYPTGYDCGGRLQVPRDGLGNLWDRLEQNRFTAFMLHAMVKRLFFHTELFLEKNDFEVFWEQHQSLRISKLQLRLIRHDSMPNSPFRDADCIAADLIVLRRHRADFLQFIATQLPGVRVNPGKQSA